MCVCSSVFGLCLVCVWSVSMRLASEKCGFCLDRVAGYTGYARYAGSVRTGSERVCGEWWRRVRCNRATGARGGRQLVEVSTLLVVVVVGPACVLVVLLCAECALCCVALVVRKVVFVVVCVPDGMASRVVVYAMMG